MIFFYKQLNNNTFLKKKKCVYVILFKNIIFNNFKLAKKLFIKSLKRFEKTKCRL